MDAGRVIELCALIATATGTIGLWFVAWRTKREVAQLTVRIGVLQQQLTNIVLNVSAWIGGATGGTGGQQGGGGGGGGGFGARGGDGGSIVVAGDQGSPEK